MKQRSSNAPTWTRAAITLLESRTLSDPAIAAKLGISTYAVKAERKRRGIPPIAPGRKLHHEVIRTVKQTPDLAARIDRARGAEPYGAWMREAAEERLARDQTDPSTT